MESKTQYRVGAAGLDPRDARLIEIVFRHSQYNRHAFVLVAEASPSSIDILIANPTVTAGVEALAAARACGRPLPAIVAVPRGTASSARHAIAIDRLTLQLLPILNRVVEQELGSDQAALSAALAPAMLAVPDAPSAQPRTSQALGIDAAAALSTAAAFPSVASSPSAAESTAGEAEPPLPSVAAPDPESAGLAAAFASKLAQQVRPRPAGAGAAPADGDDDWPTTMTSAVASAMATMGVAADTGLSSGLPAAPITAAVAAHPPRSTASHAPNRGAVPATAPSAGMPSSASPGTAADVPHEAPPPRRGAAAGAPTLARGSSIAPAGAEIRADDAAPPNAPEPSRPPPRAAPRNLVPFPAQPAAQPPRLKVLAVDDSPTVRRQLAYALDRMGLACVTEDCAESALDRLEREHVDLMLVDVELPDMDGYKLTRAVKRDRRFHRLPVVMLTSRASAFDLARGALAGCDSYLAKPVPLLTLEQTLTRVLRKSLAIDDLGGLLPDREADPAEPDVAPTAPRRLAGPS